MNLKSLILMLPLALVAGTSLANADTIGGQGSSCSTCSGAAYTLSYSGSAISSTASTQTFRITFDVNDRYYTGGGSYLNSVAIKVAAPSDIVSSSLFSSPSGYSYDGATSLSANGCGGGNSGFLCVEASGSSNGAAVRTSPYDFIFDVTVKKGALLDGSNEASVKALYVDSRGNKVGAIMSENITLGSDPATTTPEPASYVTLGTGLVGLCGYLRRRRQLL